MGTEAYLSALSTLVICGVFGLFAYWVGYQHGRINQHVWRNPIRWQSLVEKERRMKTRIEATRHRRNQKAAERAVTGSPSLVQSVQNFLAAQAGRKIRRELERQGEVQHQVAGFRSAPHAGGKNGNKGRRRR